VPVLSVGVVVVEEGFEGVWRFDVPRRGGRVDPFVGELGEEVDARFTKGRMTAAMYSPSAASAIGAAVAKSDRSLARMVVSLTGTAPPPSPTSVQASMPYSR
jgi:hypothetical protein